MTLTSGKNRRETSRSVETLDLSGLLLPTEARSSLTTPKRLCTRLKTCRCRLSSASLGRIDRLALVPARFRSGWSRPEHEPKRGLERFCGEQSRRPAFCRRTPSKATELWTVWCVKDRLSLFSPPSSSGLFKIPGLSPDPRPEPGQLGEMAAGG